MAFTWIPASTAALVRAAHINEIKANTESIATVRGMGLPTWDDLPVSEGEEVRFAHIKTLRDGADYIEDTSPSYGKCTAQYTSDNALYDNGRDITANIGVDVTQNNTVDSGYDATVLAAQNIGRDITNYGTAESNKDNTINATAFLVAQQGRFPGGGCTSVYLSNVTPKP